MASSGKKVLIVMTSHGMLKNTGKPTGVFLSEVAHPYSVLTGGGCTVDFATIKGGKPPVEPMSDPTTPNSMTKDDQITKDFWASTQVHSLFNAAKALSAVDTNIYDAVLFAGGTGAAFDFPNDPSVIRIIESFIDKGKVVCCICHGTAALLKVRNKQGRFLVEGQPITGFTDAEEDQARALHGVDDILPFQPQSRGLETEFNKLGASFQKLEPWAPFVTTALGGLLITGQQQNSGTLLAQRLLETFKNMPSTQTSGISATVKTGKQGDLPVA